MRTSVSVVGQFRESRRGSGQVRGRSLEGVGVGEGAVFWLEKIEREKKNTKHLRIVKNCSLRYPIIRRTRDFRSVLSFPYDQCQTEVECYSITQMPYFSETSI